MTLTQYQEHIKTYTGYTGTIDYDNIDLDKAKNLVVSVNTDGVNDLGELTRNLASHLGLPVNEIERMTFNKESGMYALCHVVDSMIARHYLQPVEK